MKPSQAKKKEEEKKEKEIEIDDSMLDFGDDMLTLRMPDTNGRHRRPNASHHPDRLVTFNGCFLEQGVVLMPTWNFHLLIKKRNQRGIPI